MRTRRSSAGPVALLLAVTLVGWPLAGARPAIAATGSATSPADWDESGFATAGGVAPAVGTSSTWIDAEVSTLADGSLLLAYVDTGHRLRWERYTASGSAIRVPRLSVGVLDRPLGERLEVATADAAAMGTGAVVAEGLRVTGGGSDQGTAVVALGADLRPAGPVAVLDRQYDPAVAVAGDRVWVAVTDNAQVFLDELQLVGGVLIQRHHVAVGRVATGQVNDHPEIAVDGGRLAIVYLHHLKGNCTTGEIRMAVVDAATVSVQRDVTITSGKQACPLWRSPRNAADVVSSGGTATVHWYTVIATAGSTVLGFAQVALATGQVTQLPSLAPDSTLAGATWPLRGEMNDHELAVVGGATYLLALDRKAVTIDRISYGRFKLYRWNRTSIGSTPIVLDGGFPIRADVLVELGAYRQNPQSAVVTRRSILEGAVFNRGLRDASTVRVTVSVAGAQIGVVTIGTVKANQRRTFAIDWIPADTPASSVEVRYALTTPTGQYTTGNDSASFTARIVQAGVIWGTLVDISADMQRDSAWSVGVPGATVCIGGGVPCAVTGDGGFFRFDNLAFGSYSVTATHARFKPAGPQAIGVSRSSPIADVALFTDNHGVVRLRVQSATGSGIAGATVRLAGSAAGGTTPASGTLAFDLPAGTYRFDISRHGYWSEIDRAVTVAVGQDLTIPVPLQAATEADLAGTVVDRFLQPVAGATVTIAPLPSGPSQTVRTDASGAFGPVRVAANPSKSYRLTATSAGLPGLSGSATTTVYGGDRDASTLVIAPAAATSLLGSSATEGYTSWMVKASWPGFMSLPSAAMYAWYGNYSIRIGVQSWSDTKAIAGVTVAVQGGTYETHATTSEVDFTEMNQDYGRLFDVTAFSEAGESTGQSVWRWVTQTAGDAIDIGGSVKDLITGEGAEDAVITGQGVQVLTWKEAKSDFAIEDVTDIPLGFAIPICIGGSSEERTSVRVDRVDLVNVATKQVLWTTAGNAGAGAHPWYDWQGTDHDNLRGYSVTTPGINATTTAVYVWLRVGKTTAEGGTPSQTAFEQRAEQVVIFRPSTKAMAALIASGDLYQHAAAITAP